jgi:TetR/AcrR family transcriptional regulator
MTALTVACQSNNERRVRGSGEKRRSPAGSRPGGQRAGGAAATTRAQQRDATRDRIIEAAARTFAERGFGAASTREIAAGARVNQGLITYHFQSKHELWKAAADHIFAGFRRSLAALPAPDESAAPRQRARETVRQYVRFVAAHPELFRLMVEEGKHADARLRWLVDTHLTPIYEAFARLVERYRPGVDRGLIPHLYYALAGAGSMMFALRPECQRLTGLDPAEQRVVEAHAELIATLLIP